MFLQNTRSPYENFCEIISNEVELQSIYSI